MLYPIGIQSFSELRTGGFAYVDKTAHIHRLATTGKYYFLSRPRRFGKSLLISTMEAYFLGQKELFEGLAMEKLESEWTEYPVLRLDLNTGDYSKSSESLYNVLNASLETWEGKYGSVASEKSPELRFWGIVRRAYEKTGRRVVILVDEYDKPLLQAIGNEELQDDYRNTLKAFYSVLKTQDQYIRFAFLTGVTKFSKVSIFSDLNNLNDISFDKEYTDICGITEAELHSTFRGSILELGRAAGMDWEQTCAKLREQYDGYHFRQDSPGIYNPFSVLNTFSKREFRNYWFETGTPTFLVEVLRHNDYDLDNLQTQDVSERTLNSIDSMMTNPVPLLYQSGYLTIVGYDSEFNKYSLDFPNREVEDGFANFLTRYYLPDSGGAEFSVVEFVKDVRAGRAEEFMQRLQAMFDGNDYHIMGDLEIYFHNTLYVFFNLMGLYTRVERSFSRGRADITVETKDYIYIIEIKRDKSADDALRQIEERGYARPFAADSRQLFKIGINFSSATRTISEWKIAQ